MSKTADLVALGMAPELATVAGRRNLRDNITAAGANLAAATLISEEVNFVTTVPASSGVRLDSIIPVGEIQEVVNLGANALNVYPHSASGTINGGVAGAAQSVATGKTARFLRRSVTDWRYLALD